MKRILTTLALILGLCPSAALADFNATAGSGLVIFGFTCFSTKVCTAWVPINSAGTELFTGANPGIATGSGTAGTAATGVLTVQGIASMTPLIVTNSGTFAVQAAQAGTWNVTNISGTVSLPTGAATAANQGLLTTWGGGTLGAMANYGTSPGAVLVPGVNSFITNVPAVSQSGTWNITNVSGTVSLPTGAATSANQSTEITALNSIATNTAAAIPAGTNVIGFVSNDPCSQSTKLGAPINLTASGQVITGTSAKKTYICAIDLMVTTAGSAALVEGTGSVCATNIFGLAGGTTAGTGWPVPATGGLTKGAGSGTVISPSADTNGTAANVCLLLSGTGQTSGHISYVQQ